MAPSLTLPEIEQALRIQKHLARLSPPTNIFRNARATHIDSKRSKKSSNYTQKREAWGNSWWSPCLPAILTQRKAELHGLQNAHT